MGQGGTHQDIGPGEAGGIAGQDAGVALAQLEAGRGGLVGRGGQTEAASSQEQGSRQADGLRGCAWVQDVGQGEGNSMDSSSTWLAWLPMKPSARTTTDERRGAATWALGKRQRWEEAGERRAIFFVPSQSQCAHPRIESWEGTDNNQHPFKNQKLHSGAQGARIKERTGGKRFTFFFLMRGTPKDKPARIMHIYRLMFRMFRTTGKSRAIGRIQG